MAAVKQTNMEYQDQQMSCQRNLPSRHLPIPL